MIFSRKDPRPLEMERGLLISRFWYVRLVDPRTLVLDRDVDGLGRAPDCNRDRALLEAELRGVDDEVRQRLREATAVAPHTVTMPNPSPRSAARNSGA